MLPGTVSRGNTLSMNKVSRYDCVASIVLLLLFAWPLTVCALGTAGYISTEHATGNVYSCCCSSRQTFTVCYIRNKARQGERKKQRTGVPGLLAEQSRNISPTLLPHQTKQRQKVRARAEQIAYLGCSARPLSQLPRAMQRTPQLSGRGSQPEARRCKAPAGAIWHRRRTLISQLLLWPLVEQTLPQSLEARTSGAPPSVAGTSSAPVKKSSPPSIFAALSRLSLSPPGQAACLEMHKAGRA